jgi:hypothetical protein
VPTIKTIRAKEILECLPEQKDLCTVAFATISLAQQAKTTKEEGFKSFYAQYRRQGNIHTMTKKDLTASKVEKEKIKAKKEAAKKETSKLFDDYGEYVTSRIKAHIMANHGEKIQQKRRNDWDERNSNKDKKTDN